jgi:hypothetical protein
MSWSVFYMGKADKVSEALTAHSGQLTGQSKVEYDNALPHLTALVNQNFGNDGEVIKIAASGDGVSVNGEQIQNYCSVEIQSIYGVLV